MLGKMQNYNVDGNKIQFSFEGQMAYIEVIRKDIINVFVPYETNEHRSKAIEGEKAVETAFTICEEIDAVSGGKVVVISTEKVITKVSDGFYVDFYRKDGSVICTDYREKRVLRPSLSEKSLAVLKAEGHDVGNQSTSDYPVQVVKAMEGNEKFYGLGDKTGFLNKRDYEYVNWNSDIPQAHTDDFRSLYKSIPFLITLKENGAYGLFFDNTYKSYINLGKEKNTYFYYGADAGNLDYYLIAGTHMTEVVSGYTYLTGTTPLPQFWTLGYHQSRWGYDSADVVREIAKKYRKLQIPCDTIHFDIDYMDGYRVFTWNEADYGRPGDVLKEIAKDGFKSVCIIDPGVKLDAGYEKYDEGIANDYFAKNTDGSVYVNAVWPGDSVYPDFGSPAVRSWWAENQKYLIEIGCSGTWNDMNEPASFHGELPKDIVFMDEDRPSTHAAMHNVYGHLMAKATYEGLKNADGKRPFVITRACYAGTQKYSTVWTGDNQSLWAHLQMAIPQLCNLGLSGLSFAGTDVGGFGADCTPELLCRWVQVGAFSPLFRNHSSNGCIYQEPWQFGEETVAVYRKFVELRYRLLPYIYDLFWKGEKDGLPLIRPLVLHYEEDENTWNLNDEFLLGEQLLIAPVVTQGTTKRMVYLPKGSWYDFFSGKEYQGNSYYLIDAPIDTCPVFAKAGSIIPTYELMQYVGEKPYDVLKIIAFPGEGSYVHYQDNGQDFAYRDGAYNLYEFTKTADGKPEVKMLANGYENTYKEITYQQTFEK